MKTQDKILLTGFLSFSSGYLLGMFFAPEASIKARRAVAEKIKARGQVLEEQLHTLEKQLAKIEGQLKEAGQDLSDKVKEFASSVVPTRLGEMVDWEVDDGELTRDLRHMPKR